MQRLLTRYICVCVGGAAGSLLRYVLGSLINNRYSGRFPLATFTINVTGSFLIGLILTILTERAHVNPNWRPLIIVGFLGGYTTFSAFEWETYTVIGEGFSIIALLYVILSVIVGYAGCWAGAMAARASNP